MKPVCDTRFYSSEAQNSCDEMNRIYYIDAVKGVAILCITLLHFEDGIIPRWLNNWIGSFMVAAFYFTSGWVTSAKVNILQPRALFQKRIRQLGIPYLWFSLAILLFDLIWCLAGFSEYKVLARDLYKTLVLRGIGTLWFLPVLLFSEWLFSWVFTRKNPWIWAFGLLAISLAVSHLYFKYLPMRERCDWYKILEAPLRPVVYSLKAWPVIALGYWGGKYLAPGLSLLKKYTVLTGSLLLLAVSLLLAVYPVDGWFLTEWLSNTLPVLGFIGIFAVLSGNMISGFFSYWGRHSLILMCLHFSILQEICKAIHLRIWHQQAFTGIITLLYFVLALMATWLLIPLFKTKLRFMIGK